VDSVLYNIIQPGGRIPIQARADKILIKPVPAGAIPARGDQPDQRDDLEIRAVVAVEQKPRVQQAEGQWLFVGAGVFIAHFPFSNCIVKAAHRRLALIRHRAVGAVFLPERQPEQDCHHLAANGGRRAQIQCRKIAIPRIDEFRAAGHHA
jgi:hypothetical protein